MTQVDSHIRFAQSYLENLRGVLENLPLDDLARVIECLERAYTEGRQVFLAGNGGSAATASHMANDLVKGVAKGGNHGFRAISLSDNTALITAVANDEDYSQIFASQLVELGQTGDVLIVITGSGNSPNILRVTETAREMGITTIGFLGMGGGKVAKMTDISVIVPSNEYGPVEDVHMTLDHLITAYLRQWSADHNHDGGR